MYPRFPIYFLFFTATAWLACKSQSDPLFVLLDAKQTGINFVNEITESDSLNIMEDEFIYNGGGVGVGDLNGDGLPDLYFTGNQVENRLYLNRGQLQFQDVTSLSGAQKYPGQWSSGVNILDLNSDGKADIYVCNTFVKDPQKRKNLLFINQGNNPDGIPLFLEMAAAYGLDDTTHSSHAQFFDRDNDGDLDLFIGVNVMDTKIPNRYIQKVTDGSSPNCDRLYRNDGAAFTDISKASGILHAGFSHSTLTADFNRDGWQDIYVANDYVSNDLMYLNRQNGQFENQIGDIFKHQAASAMGSDLGDVNKDGLSDLFTTEMLPFYNKRKKLFLSANNYSTYINNKQYDYEFQYGRNVFQLNRGKNPETGLPVFSDIAFLTGTQETEWSWAPLLADFDNNGWPDLFVTNGFPRDVTDHDFSLYYSSERFLIPPIELQERIPQVKSPKFLFKNHGNLHFEDFSEQAGVDIPAFSNGAAYADLDLDGDLDIVVNNIDDPAFVFKNTSNDRQSKPNFLRVRLQGTPQNLDAIGAEVTAFSGNFRQTFVVLSGRGYLSCPEKIAHFGFSQESIVDSVVVMWCGGARSVVRKPAMNQVLQIHFADTPGQYQVDKQSTSLPWLRGTDLSVIGLDYLAEEHDYIDFNAQPTLPHKYTQYGPAMSVGDVNGDGLDDLFIGGSAQHDAVIFNQTSAGKFEKRILNLKTELNKQEEDLGAVLFDADSDGDLDLFIARGSPQQAAGWSFYQDVLYENDGKGNFTLVLDAIPQENACNQTAKAADFDGDGDLDLFVGGRVVAKQYPRPDRSFILRNDTSPGGKIKFSDVTDLICPEIRKIGLISDALWTDFNNDFQPDLVVAGEWMPLCFFQQKDGKLLRIDRPFPDMPEAPSGWWTSLCAADFDSDGDMDYVAGNFGQNTYFQCSEKMPLRVYAKDFDQNGVYDPFISCYWRDSLGKRREYLYHTRDDILKQLIPLRKRFNTYSQMGEATVQDIFSKKDLDGAQILSATEMTSCYVENRGGGRFHLKPLPVEAQLAPLYGMLPFDLNGDGRQDLLLVGNDYGMELLQGRADAFYGLALLNDGSGSFTPLSIEQSHFFVPGDARALVSIPLAGGPPVVLAAQNASRLKGFVPTIMPRIAISVKSNEMVALVQTANSKQRIEYFYGNGFLSQSARALLLTPMSGEVLFFDRQGRETRRIPLPGPYQLQ